MYTFTEYLTEILKGTLISKGDLEIVKKRQDGSPMGITKIMRKLSPKTSK